jgi:type II secretory pathway pseudopilin PulG
MIKKLPWTEIVVTVLALAAGVAVYMYAHRDEGRLEQSKERGARIVQALSSYHAEQGTYPETLDELVPEHIGAVEPPSWGLERWTYRRYTPADVSASDGAPHDVVYFQLSVAANESGYPVLFYDLAASRWVLNN